MFIVCPSTLMNRRALETRTVPKRMIGRISIIPRRGARVGTVFRLLFEVQVLRYLGALTPFVIAMFVWPHLALPISQAPIPMLIVIAIVETRVLSIPLNKREGLISDEDVARTEDALAFNARRVLTRIIARKGLKRGTVHLVLEQSELARIAPLTLVSVQLASAAPEVLDLDATERDLITKLLFDKTLTEDSLQLVGLRQKQMLRSVVLEAQEISAHARVSALMNVAPKSDIAFGATS
ncbi:MAG: hypothetical protein AAGA74_15450 [Pseudomonadota bacterium]